MLNSCTTVTVQEPEHWMTEDSATVERRRGRQEAIPAGVFGMDLVPTEDQGDDEGEGDHGKVTR